MMTVATARGVLLASLATIAIGGRAMAQTAEAPAAAPPQEAASDDGGLGEIIVTAQKRSENLQRVPVSVSALSSAQLDQQKIRNVTSIVSQIPSLQVTGPFSDGLPVFSIRGISSLDFGHNQSSPVALYVDEVYKGLPVLSSLQIFDLDRVEVLRGPQGTLFGKNTTGGAVNIFTKQPDLGDGWTGYLSGGIGNLARREVNGGANVPLVEDKLAGRIAFSYTNVDGFVRNRLPGKKDQGSIDDFALRASLLYKPSDGLRFLLRGTRTRSTPDNAYGGLAKDIGVAGPGGVGFGTGYTRAGLGFFENESDRDGVINIHNQGVSLTTNWDLSDSVALTAVSAYDEGRWFSQEDSDATPFRIQEADFYSRAKAYSQDLRLASSSDGPLQWMVGAYYYRDKVDFRTTYKFYYEYAGDADGNGQLDCFDDGLTGCGYDNALRQVRTSLALYTQNSYKLDSGLSFTLGLRYTHDNNRLKSYRSTLRYLDPATGQEVLNAAVIFDRPPVDKLKSENLSWKLGVSQEFAGGALAYANYSRGWRGGAFNGQAFFAAQEVTAVGPERLDSWEVGLKYQTPDRRLRINTAAFYYIYRDQQFIDVTPNFLQLLTSAPRSRLWGVEADVVAQPLDPLTVRFSVAYLNAKFREVTVSGVDLSGKRLILAPEWTLSGGIDWRLAEGDFGGLLLHTDSRFTSRVYYSAFNLPLISQKANSLHDARLTWQLPGKRLSLSAWMKNIFNEKTLNFVADLGAGYNYNFAQRGRPREYGIEARFEF
ncbi:TonB-dependent receptor [Rhizorhabdus wittichii]|uniref:TonB-dependent receptor n=1 Tax=Rhizorhabdus wittichii TaxID=160791 RepID=UPI0002EAF81A|nr:TonB-dependent receptor [Rhizorhabdus wittichii]